MPQMMIDGVAYDVFVAVNSEGGDIVPTVADFIAQMTQEDFTAIKAAAATKGYT